MEIVVVGDIHGHFEALDDLLRQVVPELTSTDVLVFLGDYIDRGPESRLCVQRIIDLKRERRFEVITLLGNHEQWMLRSLKDSTQHSWIMGMEAFDTITSYSEPAAEILREELAAAGMKLFTEEVALSYGTFFAAMGPEHLEFFHRLRPYYLNEGILCTHGGADPTGGPPGETNVDMLIWGSSGWPEHYRGPLEVVYGHWNNARPQPYVPGNGTFGLDSIGCGVLTAMKFPSHRFFQSRHR